MGLLSGGSGTLALIVAGVVAVLGFIWRVFAAGKKAERVKNLQQSNKQWVEANDLIGKAQDARRDAGHSATGDGLHDDDGFKRP